MTVADRGAIDRFDAALADIDRSVYVLTLFVSGASDLSRRAIANTRRLCDAHLQGRYRLSVLDVHESSLAALEHQVLAAPTLIKHSPLPEQKFVGDLSRTDVVLHALGIAVAETEAQP